MKPTQHRVVTMALCLIALAAGSSTPARAIEFRMVAVNSGAAPGLADPFVGFGAPKLNSAGEVAFDASVGPSGGPYTTGVFSEGDGVGALRKVALVGEPAPGTGKNFTVIEQPEKNLYINDNGNVAFQASVTGFTQGLWTDRDHPGTALTKIAYAGDPAPGLVVPRNYQSAFSYHAFGQNHNGVAFTAILTVPANPPNNFPSTAVFSEGAGGALNKIAQTGVDLAPGTMTGGGQQTRYSAVYPPAINDAGYVAFAGESIGGGAVIGQAGVWTNSPSGTLRQVGLQGQAAPGTSTTFSQLFRDSPVISNNGNIAFMATLSGPIAGNIREGLWVERAGVVSKVAYESEPAPGTATTFSDMRDALIDGQGRVAFVSQLADGRDGLWRETAPGTLAKVGVQGDAVPGTAFTFVNFNDFAVNATGQVAFKAQMSNFQNGIFATDTTGAIQKVLAPGDMVTIDGDLMEASFVDFHGNNGGISANGLSNGFNDAGQVALVASFNSTVAHPNGLYGVFVATLSAAPSANFDGDGDVDGADFLTWQRGFGGNGATPGNANGDNVVDALDLAVWQQQFGQPTGPAMAVPEPCTIVGSAALLLALPWSARRRRQS